MASLVVSNQEVATAQPSKGGRRIASIQALRGMAALLVVFGHARSAAVEMDPGFRPGTFATAWGVDLFFVISGFIIVYSSERLFGTRAGPRQFLWRRATRVVPLYWIATTVWLCISMMKGNHDSELNLGSIALSYLFIPNLLGNPDYPVPVLSLGWTLNYEMFFYVVFAGFLFLRRTPGSLVAAGLLAAFVLIGAVVPFGAVPIVYWSQPIILEFVLGILIALALRHGLALPAYLRVLVIAGAVGLLAADPLGIALLRHTPNDFSRLLSWGIPACAIFAATVFGVDPLPKKLETPAVRIGDASYVLYLFHPIVLGTMKAVWPRLHLHNSWLFVVCVIAGSVALALLLHALIEKPLVSALQNFGDRKSRPQPLSA